MKTNPVTHYIRKVLRSYEELLGQYGERAKLPLKNVDRVTVFNQSYLMAHYTRLTHDLGDKTRSFIVEAVFEVVQATLNIYNEKHRRAGREPLGDEELSKLQWEILKDFLTTEFKGRTLDARITHATHRLMANLHPILQQYAMDSLDGSLAAAFMGRYFTGKTQIPGGTAARWNGRLIVSELFRAYQYAAKEILIRLDVPKVQWANTKKHTNPNITDEYAATTYTPRQIPEYPHPLNDSFFVPIYEEE
jgi:hypothetical protein